MKFFKGKKIFITGHTGFKGSWLCYILKILDARVCGYSLKQEKESLFNILEIEKNIEKSIISDIYDHEKLSTELKNFSPEIIIHMAAQPLVRESYKDPRYSYKTNVIGTLNVFEAALQCDSVKSVVNITTDKCYENLEIDYRYKEDDKMGGYDPYSSSKACSEILTSSYRRSFFNKAEIGLASVRAGNVIGGGDFSVDRIIPDLYRCLSKNQVLEIRSPNAIRPWQHVLEPLFGYLKVAMNLHLDYNKYSCAYNFGPNEDSEVNVEGLIKALINRIGFGKYEIALNSNLHEALTLKLDNSFSKNFLGWKPLLDFDKSVSMTADWYKEYIQNKENIKKFTVRQIEDFINLVDYL